MAWFVALRMLGHQYKQLRYKVIGKRMSTATYKSLLFNGTDPPSRRNGYYEDCGGLHSHDLEEHRRPNFARICEGSCQEHMLIGLCIRLYDQSRAVGHHCPSRSPTLANHMYPPKEQYSYITSRNADCGRPADFSLRR